MGSMEQANKALSKELEEVKGTLGLTQETLKTTEELKTTYHRQINTCAGSLTSAVKELLATLGKVTPFYSHGRLVDAFIPKETVGEFRNM